MLILSIKYILRKEIYNFVRTELVPVLLCNMLELLGKDQNMDIFNINRHQRVHIHFPKIIQQVYGEWQFEFALDNRACVGNAGQDWIVLDHERNSKTVLRRQWDDFWTEGQYNQNYTLENQQWRRESEDGGMRGLWGDHEGGCCPDRFCFDEICCRYI